MSNEDNEGQSNDDERRVTVPLGTEHEVVREVQEFLRETGYDPGETTGVFDDTTRQALAAYQEEHDLEATGQLTGATLESLEIDASVEEELPEVEFERKQFRELLAKNPNYFGTQPQFDAEPVEVIEANTDYEELMCVGYEPDTERLEAVVHVKRSYGYGGDICSSGSPEYVRFYKENRDDPKKDWDDLGLRHFTAYDIPSDEELEYGVSLQIDPEEWVCEEENLPEVRAILSWNKAPPANQPNYTPVWGNSLDATIQIDPITEFTVPDLGDLYEFHLPDHVLSGLDTTQTLSFDPPALESGKLVEKYANTSVQPHRYGFSQLTTTLDDPVTDDLLDAQFDLDPFPGADIDPGDIVDGILETSGDTYYEELHCVGLTDHRLNAVLTLKRSNGYSGGLCTGGSNEYVAFWAWDAGASRWTHLGTSAVNVHDIENMPSGGLQYATALPASLVEYRQPCEEGASILKVRATLSWEQPPPPNAPYWTPTWGNSMETHVHVPPGPTPDEGESEVYLDTVGSMAPCDIDQSSGLADGPDSSTLGGFTADKSPFGGTVVVTGTVINPPQYLGNSGVGQLQYRVRVRPMNAAGTSPEGPWRAVKETFNVRVLEKTGPGLPVSYWKTQKPDPDGFYDYLVDRAPEPWRDVRSDVLTEWHTGDKEGMWELQLQVKEPGGTVRPADAWACAAGGTRSSVLVRLDNTQPTAKMEIEEVQPQGSSSWLTANECGKVDLDPDPDHESFPSVGDTIKGSYEASDENIHHLSLTVHPGRYVPSGAISVDGTGGNRKQFPSSATHDAGNWTLDTTGMKSCGYVARFRVEDRTIVNSRHIGWRAGVTHGFCLDESAETDGGATATVPLRGEVDPGTGSIAELPIAIGETQFDSPGDDHENLNEEYVTVENVSDSTVDLGSWQIEDTVGHAFTFPEEFTLPPGNAVTIRSGTGDDSESELHWGSDRAVWDNTGDTLFLYDDTGSLVLKRSY